ncbi:carbon storage regulator [Peribacillus saganii]|uniref:Translational regulator CsrA n=1 Tax=Peribacillus saganii TaxID=2303992 RepID=A0A372LM67_9BACI|nr:carbon storage regulator CsrA [Peribacillus saganii]RFU68297.1 carbon storage regulator [Peribacillus saganii]
MLVLTRKNGESIKIGEDIEITILTSKNDQVKIGIKAPDNIEIVRKELFEQIQQENKEASDIMNLMEIIKKNKEK